MKKEFALSSFLTEYIEKNSDNKYKPVAIGRYGIRTRESIYKKELAKDYSKNKLIYKNTLTVGMGSSQIDIGVLGDDITYSVSPAYHTYRITDINSNYLKLCLEFRNKDMFDRFAKRGSRQGKSINLKQWLTYEIPVHDVRTQAEIVENLDKVSTLIKNRQCQLELLNKLVKSRFIEMFGDPVANPMGWNKKRLSDECDIITGNTPSRKVPEYYGDYIEWIKSDNINTPNSILTNAEEYLSQNGLQVGRYVEAGAILMTCIAGSIGCIGNVAIADRKVAFNQQINGIVPKANNTWFLYVLFELSKKEIQSSINMALKGILSKGQLSEMEFIFPPLDLQNEFAIFVEQTDKSKFECSITINLLNSLTFFKDF